MEDIYLLTTYFQWWTLYEILGGSCQRHRKILKFESRKLHLQHSENTFCKKLGFQNTVLMVHFVINHMLSIENQNPYTRGTPNTSVVVAIVVKSDSSSALVASTPCVRLLQCRANSLLPTALRTAAVDGFLTPLI